MKPQPWMIALLILATVMLDGVVLSLFASNLAPTYQVILFLLWESQAILLGLWLVLGNGHWLARLFTAGIVAVSWAAAFHTAYLRGAQPFPGINGLEGFTFNKTLSFWSFLAFGNFHKSSFSNSCLLSISFVTAAVGTALLARFRGYSWASTRRQAGPQPWQYSLAALLAVSTGVAIGTMLLRNTNLPYQFWLRRVLGESCLGLALLAGVVVWAQATSKLRIFRLGMTFVAAYVIGWTVSLLVGPSFAYYPVLKYVLMALYLNLWLGACRVAGYPIWRSRDGYQHETLASEQAGGHETKA